MTVYWIKGRSENIRKNLVSRIDRLMRLEALSSLMIPDTSLAIKFNLSEIGYGHYSAAADLYLLFRKGPVDGGETDPDRRLQCFQRIAPQGV